MLIPAEKLEVGSKFGNIMDRIGNRLGAETRSTWGYVGERGGSGSPRVPPPRDSNLGPYGEVRRGHFVAVGGVRQRIPHAVHPLGEGVGGLF